MRTFVALPFLASAILAAAACTPPQHAAPDPLTPASVQPAVAHAGHDGDDHDHDGDHDHHDGDEHDHHHHAPPKSTSAEAANVKILQTTELSCGNTIALGPVDVHEPMKNEEDALDMLRRRAADLGAEAVLGVEFHHGEGGEQPTHLSGLAVKCGDLLQDRAYDVIGKLDIPGGMGEEDEAFDALKAKAASMGADLVLDVEFHHGDGSPGSSTHVSGTAVKLR